jgi:hypothetical protein
MSGVSAYPARCHIENLCAAGWGYREIAKAARIDRGLVAFIVAGRAKIDADAAFRICCLDPARQSCGRSSCGSRSGRARR